MNITEICLQTICSNNPYGMADILLTIGIELAIFAFSYFLMKLIRIVISVKISIN